MKHTNIFTIALLLITGLTGFNPTVVLAEEEERAVAYWVAPMDPNYRRNKAGKSPMGMDLVPVYKDEVDTGPGVKISPEVVQNLGVRTQKVEYSRLWKRIDTVGYVNYDESLLSHIHLRTEGWIENLAVHSAGERVSKGTRLFDLYSPALVNAQEEFIQVLRSGNKRLIQASRERLRALGISNNLITQIGKDRKTRHSIPIYASQNGIVSNLPVAEGMYVKPATRVMTLADLSSVWLIADIYEKQSAWVQTGQSAEVRLAYQPGTTWEGTVEYIYPELDAKTRTLKARLRFDNPDELLKPNMYAQVRIYGGGTEEGTVIPLPALIRSGEEDRVIVALGEGRFEARQITTGIESGDWIQVLAGVQEGEEVVVSGQFLIDSEASLKASTQRLSPSMEEEQ
ncbi:MAG: efflux RND transporter periplasmic adaptor subunit [Proteobacteria bacterium]|nr:efflux RND transporter periplasmic adaptor subunit [Pseudomonadota bacterium]